MDFTELQKHIARTARDHGFWDVDPIANPSSVDRKLMLIVGEISEAHEDWRKQGLVNTVATDGKPCGFASELADSVIRIMDLAEQLDIDLETVIKEKDRYNQGRPYLHGKRF